MPAPRGSLVSRVVCTRAYAGPMSACHDIVLVRQPNQSRLTVPPLKRRQTGRITFICKAISPYHLASAWFGTIGTIRTSWLDLVHPGATQRARFVTVCPGLPWFDPGLLTGRWGGGSETPQKSTIKLDRGHDKDGLQRVTVRLCISHSS